jgi:heterogeneous nuclear rnp K-like protein 2
MAEPQSPQTQEASAPSQKRPLEEPSSPSGPNDGPDAKRPALDKILKNEVVTELEPDAAANNSAIDTTETVIVKSDDKEGIVAELEALEAKDKQGDTVVPDAPATTNGSAATNQILETQPVQSHANGTAHGDRAGSQAPHYDQRDETGWLHVRAIISSAEAATVIGKGGENVSQIRRMAGAKCTVSEYSRGAVERILTVSGLVDAVAKVCGSSIHF